MYFFHGFLKEKKDFGLHQQYSVVNEHDHTLEKSFDNFRLLDEIYNDVKTGDPIILVLEYEQSSVPLAISFDGNIYYKSKNQEHLSKTFRMIKNEFHNIVDKNKNKNKILKSFFIPFYSQLIPAPYYLIIMGFYFMVLNISFSLSNFEFITLSLLLTYITSIVFITFETFNIKSHFKKSKRWVHLRQK